MNNLQNEKDFKLISENTALNSLCTAEIDGFKVQWKNDGINYPAIWQAFRKKEIEGKAIAISRPYRATHLLELDGRSYLMKKDWHVEKRLEKRFLYFLMGRTTRYSRIIQLINKAILNGCRSAQDVFLTAEKMEGSLCVEAWLIADYMPGHALSKEEAEANMPKLVETVRDIHRHKLACNDIQPYNFIISPEGEIKGIDMDISSPLFICQANDIWTMKRRFGAKVPFEEGAFGLHLAWAVIGVRDFLRSISRKIRSKPDYIERPK